MIGVDPRPFTYRKLVWMRDGKGRHDYDLMISLVCFFSKWYSGDTKFVDSNPYSKVPLEMSDEMKKVKREADLDTGMLALEVGLAMIAGVDLQKIKDNRKKKRELK